MDIIKAMILVIGLIWYVFVYGSDANNKKRSIEKWHKSNIEIFGKVAGKKINRAQDETRKRLNTVKTHPVK